MSANIRSSFGVGRVSVSEVDWFFTNDKTEVRPPMIFCHGAGVWPEYVFSQPGHMTLLRELSKYFTIGMTDLGGDSWGSSVVVSRIDTLRTYMNANLGTSGAFTLVGISMGTLSALNYAKEFPANVRAVCGIIPALSIQDLYDNRGYAASINAAYTFATGISWASTSAANRKARDANQWVTDSTYTNPLASVPVMLMPANSDTVTPISFAQAFQAARPSTKLITVGSSGHSEQSVIDATPKALEFCRSLRG